MQASNPVNNKFKLVWKYFPNLAILTKSATPGKVKLAFVYSSVGNKFLGLSVTVFSLTGSLDFPSVVLIDSDITFAIAGGNICLPIAKVLICASAGNLARSKK